MSGVWPMRDREKNCPPLRTAAGGRRKSKKAGRGGLTAPIILYATMSHFVNLWPASPQIAGRCGYVQCF